MKSTPRRRSSSRVHHVEASVRYRPGNSALQRRPHIFHRFPRTKSAIAASNVYGATPPRANCAWSPKRHKIERIPLNFVKNIPILLQFLAFSQSAEPVSGRLKSVVLGDLHCTFAPSLPFSGGGVVVLRTKNDASCQARCASRACCSPSSSLFRSRRGSFISNTALDVVF